jgi:hypothetical protein
MTRLRQRTLALIMLVAASAATGCGDDKNSPTPQPSGSGGRGMGGRSGAGGAPAGTGGSPSGSGGAPAADGGTTDGINNLGELNAPAVGTPVVAAPNDVSWLTKPVPVLWITTDGARGADGIAKPASPKAMRTLGRVKVIQEHDGSALTDITGKTAILEAPVLLEGRGSSSYGLLGNAPFNGQRGYGMEFHDGARSQVGHVLLGMPKSADWALVPCFSDKTCMRNALTYAFGREISAPRWTPRTRWAEVYIDGKYWGLYTIAEKVKDDNDRVNLPKAASTAPPAEHAYMISGNGDVRSLKWDALKPGEGFLDARARMNPMPTPTMPMVEHNRRWKWREPNPEDTSAEQLAYVTENFDKLHAAIETGMAGWKNLIDIPSWIDYFVVSELTNNVDAFFKSWYFYKLPAVGTDPGKWYMGPFWDYDLAYGNTNYHLRFCATNTRIGPLGKQPPAAALAVEADLPPPPFITTALRDVALQNQLRCRWNELRKAGGPLELAKLDAKIDAFTTHIKTAAERHSQRWMNLGVYIWPNNYVGATWDDEVKYLKYWLRKRLVWVDAKLPGTCTATPNPAASTVPQIPAPASVTADRSKEPWGGEAKLHHTDYVDPDATTPLEWACPR